MKKTKCKKIKPLPQKCDYNQKLNYNIEKDIKPDKICPKDIFDGYSEGKKKCPKGHKVCKCHLDKKKKK